MGNTEHNNPPVLLAVHRTKHDLIEQDYSPLIIVEDSVPSPSAPEFFNDVIDSQVKDGMVVGFLSEHDYLTSHDTITDIIKYLCNTISGAVYTDGYLVSKRPIPQIMPGFSRTVLNEAIINTPLFITKELLSMFDPSFETMYFYDMFRTVGQKALLSQIPSFMISTNYHKVDNSEIERIRAKHG